MLLRFIFIMYKLLPIGLLLGFFFSQKELYVSLTNVIVLNENVKLVCMSDYGRPTKSMFFIFA